MNIKTVFDEDYGEIHYEFVANLDYDFIRMNIEHSDYQKWAKKYHPLKFFYGIIQEKVFNELSKEIEDKGMLSQNVNLYVCIDDININWDSTHWINKYWGEGSKKKKAKLPIVTSRKKIDEWKNALEELYNLAKRT